MDKEKEIYGPLSASTVRGLNDKVYDKRKVAALDVERLIKDCVQRQDTGKTARIIHILKQEFIFSTNPNSRKGGLIGISSTAVGLGEANIANYIEELFPPVLSLFTDSDSRVRYYACESMYNLTKVGRAAMLPFFNETFDGLSKLAADPDPNVKNAAELLDRQIKDVVAESKNFSVDKFVPLLKDRIYTVVPHVRLFYVRWIAMLLAVPDVNLLIYLPELLDGLLKILSDNNRDTRVETETLLAEFLSEIRQCKGAGVDFSALVGILVPHCKNTDQQTQGTALQWLHAFMGLNKDSVIPFSADVLGAILPSLSHRTETIRESANAANQAFMTIIAKNEETLAKRALDAAQTSAKAILTEMATDSDELLVPPEFPLSQTVEVLTVQFLNSSVETRCAALRWVLMLHVKAPQKVFTMGEVLFPALLKNLSDISDKVVVLSLEVMAEISSYRSASASPDSALASHSDPHSSVSSDYFLRFMRDLFGIFASDRALLEKRGAFIVRHLSLLLNPVDVFTALADIIYDEEDIEFGSIMVQTLNLILLTAVELNDLRNSLKKLETEQAKSVFRRLYKSWCHNAVATLSLCLLTQNYDLALDLVVKFGDLNITVKFLVEVDKLVQLIESPIFTYLRLQLLEPESYASLVKTLYGLLMLLPQSSAFVLLQKRLAAIPNLFAYLPNMKATKKPEKLKDAKELMDAFIATQEKHAKLIMKNARHMYE